MQGVNGVLNPFSARCLHFQGFSKPYYSTRLQCAGVTKRVTLKFKGSSSLPEVRAEIEEVSPADQQQGQRQSEEQSQSQAQAQARLSFLTRSQTYALLKKQMAVAVQNEDYKEAARLRDALNSMEEEEPALCLQSLLKKAISEERFEDATKYRNELQLIAPDAFLKCLSDTTTFGIRIQVRSVYVRGRSQPLKGQYFFAYRIRISNISDRPVQLLRRHWAITDANGKTEHIRGIGVIGEQPVILSGTSFEYSSACPLGTSTGKMEGEFEMKYVDKVNSETFEVVIGAFALSVDGDEDSP
ncbi:hypothetical protein SUGI_0258890 [Cryptomeria japonica]|nr:hypothetical protein SUGI_0258890 [Cryptomeria japonica]